MGSWYALIIHNHDLLSGKSYLEPLIGCLFSELEKIIIENDDDNSSEYKYKTTAGKMMKRLSILGITPLKSKKAFFANKKKYIIEHTEEGEYWGEKGLKKLSFKKWCDTVKIIIEDENKYYRWDSQNIQDEARKYITDSEEFFLGFPSENLREPLSIILSLFCKDEPVILDYSSLVSGGYYEPSDKMVDISRKILLNERYTNENVVLITEGKFDVYVLEETLGLLFPDYEDIFRFLDFDSSRTPGGAGQLVNYLKALSGAKITDRIIAIFDNDTAAYDAIRVLNDLDLEKNISFTTYPDYSYLNDYPTIGPTGKKNMNINKLSGSIELYLGDDILTKSGYTYPVQWTGYIRAIGKYQGEVLQKNKIQELFAFKIDESKKNGINISLDWNGIKMIWQEIFRVCEEYSI